jgi:hypothetical protein
MTDQLKVRCTYLRADHAKFMDKSELGMYRCMYEWGHVDGAVLTCAQCGFLGVWDVHYWRTPNTVEFDGLLHIPAILEAQFLPQWAAMCRTADAERMVTIFDKCVGEWLRVTGMGEQATDALYQMLIEDMYRAGFHTHHEPIEIEESSDDQ